MNNNQFAGGLELANLLVTSDLLHQSWDAIEKQKVFHKENNPDAGPSLYINETQQSNCTIITFGTSPSPVFLQGSQALVSSSTLKDFEFLCSKKNPSFSINEAAITLFYSHYEQLNLLRTKVMKPTTLTSLIIITGHSLGGCVATIFTLWLLECLNLAKTKRPLCITFGSPFIGDEHLRRCVLQFSTWNSFFLHVVSNQDPVPKLFLSSNPTALQTISLGSSVYRPFGTFLLCSASGCACLEEPESILELLEATNPQSDQNPDPNLGIQFFDYGPILEDLKVEEFCKDVSELVEPKINPLRAGIISQLQAIGVFQTQQKPRIEINNLITRMEKHEMKLVIQKTRVASFEKLNNMKIYMCKLEWYKKSSKDLKMGYYDRYKREWFESDITVKEYKKKLSNYWEDSVLEAENKPEKEGSTFRIRWLMGATNYRRMVEPLHIADYYKEKGAKNYQTEKRPRHFILLEQWLKEVERPVSIKARKQNVASCLTDDSCFWAHVEEALILCNLLKNDKSSTHEKECSMLKLKEFEGYVLEAIKNYAVSPEIFLRDSSFMLWWKEYQEVIGSSYTSPLTQLMKDGTYLQYEKGVLVLT